MKRIPLTDSTFDGTLGGVMSRRAVINVGDVNLRHFIKMCGAEGFITGGNVMAADKGATAATKYRDPVYLAGYDRIVEESLSNGRFIPVSVLQKRIKERERHA